MERSGRGRRPKNRRRKRRAAHSRLMTAGIALIFLAGLSLVLYPLLSSRWNDYRQSQLITEYTSAVSDISSTDLTVQWEAAHAYNEALVPSILPDSFAMGEIEGEEDEEYMGLLNVSGDGVMGYISIPKINVKLAIYHTTSSEVLQHGAGHLQGSSLPVGGESTHAVLSAHRGLPSASLFTDLDQLEVGDHFYLMILDETLAYEVDQILVVEPDDTEALTVTEGEDLVTLMTCTPYGVNTQRLLVRGHRTAYDEAVETSEEVGLVSGVVGTRYGLWAFGGLAVTAVLIFGIFLFNRRKRDR